MIKDSAVLFCLDDAANYLGVSVLDFKRLLQQGKIRYCQNLSTPLSDVFVLRGSVDSRLHDHYLKVATDDSVQDGHSSPDVPRMYISSADAIQTDNLGYLSYQAVHDWGYEIDNAWSDRVRYDARVFESFDGIKFSVYELERDGENEWSIQPDEPLEFHFSLREDGLLSETLFSIEELDRVKTHCAAPVEANGVVSEALCKERSTIAHKRWKSPVDFFADEDNFYWRPEEGRKSWWQVELQGAQTSNKKFFFRALLLYFLYLPEAPNPSIDTLLAFMRAYQPHPSDEDPLWILRELRGKREFCLDGSENYQPYGNMERPMLSILETRKKYK